MSTAIRALEAVTAEQLAELAGSQAASGPDPVNGHKVGDCPGCQGEAAPPA